MPHHVKASRGIVTYLVITIIFSETIIGHYAAIYPTALCKVTIEDIVEINSKYHLFHTGIVLF